jgi:hypothetical protein
MIEGEFLDPLSLFPICCTYLLFIILLLYIEKKPSKIKGLHPAGVLRKDKIKPLKNLQPEKSSVSLS